MITVLQRLSLGYRINFRLCSIYHKALHGLLLAYYDPHTPGSTRPESDLNLLRHICSFLLCCLQPDLSPANLLPFLNPILFPSWTHYGSWAFLLPTKSPAWIACCSCACLYPYLSFYLVVFHTSVFLCVYLPLSCEHQAGQVIMHHCVPTVSDI